MSDYKEALGLVKEWDLEGNKGGDLVYLVEDLESFYEGIGPFDRVIEGFLSKCINFPLQVHQDFEYTFELPLEFLR